MDNNVVAKHILDVAVGLEKKSKNELIVELSDIFDNASKIDLNSKENINSLKNLAKAFEAIFSKAGNKSINFADLIEMPPPAMFAEMGKIAATSFWDAWNSVSKGAGGNVTQEMMREQLKQLEKQREELVKRQKTLPKKHRKYDEFSMIVDDLPYMDENEFEAFSKKEIEKMGDNVDKIATDMIKAMNDAFWSLKKMTLDDPGFDKALEDTLEKTRDVFKMSRTLGKHPDLVKDKDILEEYDFDYLKDTFGEDLESYSIRLSGIIRQVEDDMDGIPLKLKEIDDQLASIRSRGVDIVDQTSAKNGLKTLNEIEEAYKKIRVAQGDRIDDRQEKHILSALEFDPSKSSQGIKVLYEQYQEAAASGDWVEEYRALLKYVKLYESYLTTTNKAHNNKITKRDNPFTPLYEQLKPMAENAKNMLQNILNMGEGKPLVGMGGTGKENAKVGPTPEDVANAQRIREEAEAKAKAEVEALEAAKQKRIEEEKAAKLARKAADEAERELKAKKESASYTAYRAVQPPEGSGKTKQEALEDWGAEYFTTRKDTAASYGENFYEKGDIVIGEITPKNPLIINANGVRWDEFEKMSGIKEMFPELMDLIKANPQWTGDDKQKYINERARAMGYDSVVTENVQDALDGDKKQYELSTTIAVLDDSIVRLTGSMEQLEAGTNKFSDKISPEIPSYYITGSQGGTDASAEVQDVGTAFKRLIDYINSSGQEPKQFFSTLASGAQNVNDELKQILSTLGLFDSQGNLNLKSIESGFTNLGGMVSDTYTLIARGKDYLPKSKDLMPKLIDAKQVGASVGEILDVFEDEAHGKIYELQKTMPGTLIPDNTDFLQATSEQIADLIYDLEILHKTGLSIDFGNDNILYDKDKGFSFIDLGTKLQEGQETVAGTAQEFLKSIRPAFADNELFASFENRLVSIANSLGVKIPQAAQVAEQAIVNFAAKQEKLNDAQNQYDSMDDDDEAIAQENGALEDKLELLRDIAEQYGNNISQKQRDRYEELNQKDMNDGLTPKEDERYWELGEQIEEADQALEEFGQTYDKIIVKLANGKKIEILPDDKGLRTLSKIDEEYGESYNGVEIDDIVFERVKQEVVATEQAVDGLNESLEKTHQLASGIYTDDASSAELDDLQQQLKAKDAEIDEANRKREEAELAERVAQDEAAAERHATEAAQAELDEKDAEIVRIRSEYQDALLLEAEKSEQLRKDLVVTEEESRVKDGVIQELREQLANVKTGAGDEQQGSVKVEELRTLLDSIVYNVKIAHDDNDKTANKIEINESTLETTLTKVFANIINPQTQQNDLEQKQAPWALESTLEAVKEVLGNIQTNTSKIGTVEASKGGVAVTKDDDTVRKQTQDDGSNKQTGSATAIKSLIGDYERLGKLRAQFEKDGNLETKAKLQNLAEEVEAKRKSLKLTTDEILGLREKSKLAYDAEKRLIEAAKAQKEINDQRKAEAHDAKKQEKDAENAWKKQVKDAQRATGINAATTAANAGDQTVLRAIGADGVSKDVENKAKELSDQIKTLRMLRDEIDKKGEQASAEDRDNLSKQIVKVKELKTEVDGYLKIHEKYSGESATQFNDVGTSGFGAVGTDQYWNNITAAIKKASTGRVTIKGMNADTGELTGTTKIAANTFAEWSATVDPITGNLSMLRTGIKKTETIIEQITRKTKEVFTYFSGSSLIFKAVNELKKGIQYVREIDLALTELKKVTDETEETYDKFLQTAAKTGARLGTTISAVTEATATFAKLGYTMKQSTEMAEAAIVYKNVGDNIASTGDAADSIISTMKGFRLEATESMAIVDRFNEVGNRFAITSQGIGEALRLSASALSEGGNSLDESIGLITAANEVVNDPSSVGTALKTLTLRLRGSKTELEEMGEDVTGMATTTSQLQAKLLALTGGKVDIMLDENTFKNSTQILREMAAAWEDMNDIQRASALELMGGKRQANTLSALIKNFDTVEKVIETSSKSAGSALKENERYLDSIQGKIDQFNNATQSMWNNFLDSDVIKFFIDLATQIIKLVDQVGLFGTALAGAFVYFTAFKKQTPLALLQQLWGVITNIGASIKANGFGRWAASLLGVVPAIKSVTAETVANTIATQTNDAAKTKDIMTSMGLTGATGTLTVAQREAAKTATLHAMSTGQLSMSQGNAILAMLGYSAATVAADGSLKTLDATTKSFMATNPIGWILAIVSVLMMVITLLSQIPSKTERLTEKLNDMKSELQDVQSELDSVNSELQTTQERMAELIAMPSLSFTEQEELNRLKEQNEELERRERLLKAQEEREKKRIAEQAVKTVESQLEDTSYTGSVWDAVAVGVEGALAGAAGGFVIGSIVPGIGNVVGTIAGAIGGAAGAVGGELLSNRISTEDKVDQEIEEYKRLASEKERLEKELETASDEKAGLFGWGKSDYEKTKKELENVEKELGETETYIDEVIKQMGANLNGVEYGYGADEILSFYDNLQYEFEIARGTIGAESDAIANIFNRPEYEATYNEIKRLQGELEKDPGNQTYLAQISEQCKKAEEDLIAVGLSADKAFDYFTMKSGSSVDDIMAQYKVAKTALEDLKSGAIGIDDIVKYDEEKGEATGRPDAIAEKLQGVTPEVRKQFTSIVEAIKEGSYDTEDGLTNWDAAIKKLELQGMQAVIASVKTELEAANKLAFPDLEISGWIDSVEELKGAFESLSGAMDLIVTAQEQMNSSGRISMKTALDLMATTDDWNQILEVNNGVITMNANAEQILIQSKLNLIKANIEMALQQVETDIALMEGAINSTKAGNAFTQGFTKALTNAQGVLVGLKAGWDAFWAGEDVASAFNGAYKSTVDNLTPDESSLGDLYTQRDNLLKQREMLEGVDTTQEFKNNYDFDKIPGDKYDEDGAANDAFQKEMDYWENRIAANQVKHEQLQNEIDLLEAKGQKADTPFYEEQIKLEKEREWLLGEQKKAAEAHLATLTEGSEEWWEVANTLNDIEGELDDVTASIVDLQDAIGEIDAYKFEEFNTRLDNLASKLESIRNLIAPDGEEDWFDDEGNWTESGVAVLGSYLQELETYKQGYAETIEELDKYAASYEGNEAYYDALGIHSEQEWYDKTEELISQQYDFAESISDTEQSIVDMYESNIDAVEEYTETLIDSYNDYIDSVKEALDAERDLYDFKKNVQKQAKDIAAIERRIASLSGSTNASDIAERRKLEAQLYESRESLNDTYYDHAKNAQSEALDKEAEAYETSMSNMIEGLRTSLEEATLNMDEFLMGVTSMVMYNADTVLSKYEETNLPLTKELTNPWEEAKKAVGSYSGNALDLMNQWTKEGGFFAQFNTSGTANLQSPWSAGTTAANSFKTSVSTVMSGVVSNIATNVRTASGELSKLYQQIQDTEKRAASANVAVASTGSGNNSGGYVAPQKKYYVTAFLDLGSRSLSITKSDSNASAAMSAAKIAILGEYEKIKGNSASAENAWLRTWRDRVKYTTQYYAKGATSTPRDEWAITDEPQFGDELVLVPGKDGNLSFMRKGTGVVPADLTANLMEWGQFTPDSMNLGGGVNVNMINNAVNKPEFNFAFDALVKAENITEETLPAVKKLVTQELNRFTKELNYALKGKGAR